MKVTMLWFDNLKGIGECFDENGEIKFINTRYYRTIPVFPKKNEIILLERL